VKILLVPFPIEPALSIKLLVESTSVFARIASLMLKLSSALYNGALSSEALSSEQLLLPVACLTGSQISGMLNESFPKVGVDFDA